MELQRQIDEATELITKLAEDIEGNAEELAKLQAAQQAGDKDKLALYTSLLYDQALLTEGLPVADPVAFAQNVCKLMA